MKQLVQRIKGRWRRERALRCARWSAKIALDRPLVSFSFDDFPRSAWSTGGALLEAYRVKGTYYVSLGLMGKMAPPGEICHLSDVEAVVENGHELGCHTFDHLDAWDTEPDAFESSINRNREMLQRLLPGNRFQTFAYPKSAPRPANKRRTAHFMCCRGGGQSFNVDQTDLNNLKAFMLEQAREPHEIEQIITQNAEARGWLIFGTHDVSPVPTRYGCSPSILERTISYALKSGATVLPVSSACRLAVARDSWAMAYRVD